MPEDRTATNTPAPEKKNQGASAKDDLNDRIRREFLAAKAKEAAEKRSTE